MSNTFIQNAKDLLCPPGNGVFTVTTAKEKKKMLHQELFPSCNTQESIDSAWSKSLTKIEDNQLGILGVPSDCGGGIHRGANWGPLYIRLEILKSMAGEGPSSLFHDLGDVRVIPHLLHDKYLNEETIKKCRTALYGTHSNNLPVSPLSMAEKICDSYYEQYPNGRIFSLGGDHSVSYPVVRSYLKHKQKMGVKVALIHFDAHTDLLEERLGIDICFGSWTTHILNELPSPNYCYQIGIRATAQERSHWENKYGVHQYWANELTGKGTTKVANEIRTDLMKKGVEEIYISFDIDALDATIAGATGTPEIGGLKTDQCFLVMRALCENFSLTGADLMEVAPFLNMPIPGKLNPEPASTMMAARSISEFFIDQMTESRDVKSK